MLYGPRSHLCDTAARKSGRTVGNGKRHGPEQLRTVRNTNAAPTDRHFSPTCTRSTRVPSVQWLFAVATMAVSSSMYSSKAVVQSPSGGPRTVLIFALHSCRQIHPTVNVGWKLVLEHHDRLVSLTGRFLAANAMP